MITYTTIDSPVGPLLLAAGDDGLQAIEFQPSRHRVKRGADWPEGDHPLLRLACASSLANISPARGARSSCREDIFARRQRADRPD